MHSRFAFLLTFAFVVSLPLIGQMSVKAQELDLGIPGLEETKPAPAAAPASDSVDGASTGSVNLLDMIAVGGWTMWILGAFSLAVIGLMVFCLMDLQKKNFHPDPLCAALIPDMEGADLEEASKKLRSTDACLSSVLLSGFSYLGEYGYGALGTEKLEDVMSAASKKFNRGRVRTINYFSIIAQAAPMVGLLGTVSGMIGAFAKLSQGGTGDPSKFAGNISEALITTASGLVIALPAIFCYFIFRDRLQSLVAECDEKAEEQMRHLRHAVASYQEEA